MARSKRSTQKKIKGGNPLSQPTADTESQELTTETTVPATEEPQKSVMSRFTDLFSVFSTKKAPETQGPEGGPTKGGKAKKSKGTKKSRK